MTTVGRRGFLRAGVALAAATPLLSACGGPASGAGYLSAHELSRAESVRVPIGDGHLAADVYIPQSVDRPVPAVVVGGSLTAVKEQMGGIYAAQLARRGFLAASVDYRNYGASSGEIRQYEDPVSKAEDLSAVVTYLATRADVDADRIALLGICTSGGTVLYTAAADSRVKAVASVASHFAEPSTAPALYGGSEGVDQRLAAARAAADRYRRTGLNQLIPAYSDVDQTSSHPGPNEYYMDAARGGGVSQWSNEFALMSWEPWLAFDPVGQAPAVTVPALVVHSDDCALPDQARKVHGLLGGPKQLHWTTGPHFEFYDGSAKVTEAADVVVDHFAKVLNAK